MRSTPLQLSLAGILLGTLLLSGCEPDRLLAGGSASLAAADPVEVALEGLGTTSSRPGPAVGGLRFELPEPGQLTLAGGVRVAVRVPRHADPASLQLWLDGLLLSSAGDPSSGPGVIRSTVGGVEPGTHELVARVRRRRGRSPVPLEARVRFEAVSLDHPDECEVLNDVECLLPYPSSRFLVPADTPTGWRIELPEVGMPQQIDIRTGMSEPVSPEQLRVLDGFSPTVQILMHFPGGVSPELSRAPRLLADRRTTDDRSLDRDSPTLLVDLDTGERVLHFIEPDARASGPERQALFLRPGRSLTPGHRYAVAVRKLVDPGGVPVEAERVFAALRDRRPTDIPAVEARRRHFEWLFRKLEKEAGVRRADLVLAFDFVVQSEEVLSGQMLSMRDQAFAWLAEQERLGVQTFQVEVIEEQDCSEPGALVWRVVEGTYQVPLFLTSDPVAAPLAPGFLNVDADGQPVANGLTNPPLTLAIPCTVLEPGAEPPRPLVVGHGLFGDGRSTIRGLVGGDFAQALRDAGLEGFDLIAGATDWRGLSTPDREGPGGLRTSWIVGEVLARLSNFSQLPDRLRQGQLNTLILARMMKQGLFNSDPAFRTPSGAGVFPGPEEQTFYFGASLGGVMGLMFAALSPDIERANVDVPAINFSLLLQRATPFLPFQDLLALTGISDPIQVALGIGLIGELWVRGESAGYATHVTANPLPGTNAKRILMTEAWLDQQVSNVATEIAARTLGLSNLKPGSLVSGLVGIRDEAGPLDSALVVYDTGSYDLANPAHAPFVPPLANLQATLDPRCDPHGLRGTIPASVAQLLAFFRPDGRVENFCDGDCDTDPTWLELPGGRDAPCDPT